LLLLRNFCPVSRTLAEANEEGRKKRGKKIEKDGSGL